MIYFLNSIITILKGENYVIDNSVPLGYLLNMAFIKLVSMLWGSVRLKTLKPIFVSPSSTIKCASKLAFGKGLNIGYRCYIDALSRGGLICGDNVSMGMYTTIKLTGSLQQIGNYVKIGNNVGLGSHGFYGCGAGFLKIGNECIFGNYVSIHPENHKFCDPKLPIRLQGVSGIGIEIGNNCWIGAKVTILDGTKIGNNCIVAAGAVVTGGQYPDNTIIGGVPARVIKKR